MVHGRDSIPDRGVRHAIKEAEKHGATQAQFFLAKFEKPFLLSNEDRPFGFPKLPEDPKQ